MEQVADEAGVALKTVYVAFMTKSGLLRALWDLRLKGDQEEAGVAERPWYREVLDEPDPGRQLRRNARNARMVKQRIAGILKVLRSAAPVDPDAAALWRLIQTDFYNNQWAIVASLHARGEAAPGPGRGPGHRHPLDPQPPRRVAAAGRRARLDTQPVGAVVRRHRQRATAQAAPARP
jgi:AcrR family transcriptional regulator